MLNRVVLEHALARKEWDEAAALLNEASVTVSDVTERWRLSAISRCVSALACGIGGRDAVGQLRELVRLADGHVRVSTDLFRKIDTTLLPEFALAQTATSGTVLLELSAVHPLFHALPELDRAVRVDPEPRRNTYPEPASSFLRRLSPHSRFSSDGQKVALQAVMMMPAGATLIAALPTGWGKSALFQIGIRRWREEDPAACLLVIVPTVALAQDHARTLAALPGLAGSRAIVGGMKASQRQAALEAFVRGEVPILLLSPEMALGGVLGAVRQAADWASHEYDGAHLKAIVIDEAHIIASWGRYFRPDFQRLPGLVRELRARHPALRTLLLSATVDLDLRTRLRRDFAGSGPCAEVGVPEPRNEFDLLWKDVSSGADRTDLVLRAIDLIPRPAIIYTTTVEDAEQLHRQLLERGYRRLELFTGEVSDPIERQRVIDCWARDTIDIVVATSAFGMGVDKPNVRAIVHACLPESAERFYQEIGRGGRDGHQALSLCLWTDGDAATAANLAIHGWMRPETSVRRWKAILEEATSKGYFSRGPSGQIYLKVPLDSRHEGLPRITGQLNRQWNSALLTLLQRSAALRIVSQEHLANGAELWVAEILRPEIVELGWDLERNLMPFLSIGVAEAATARAKARQLERALRNDEEACFRTLLFDMVDPSGSPWPCGRCPVCIAAAERPHVGPNRHDFSVAWPDQPWLRPSAIGQGALVIDPDNPRFGSHMDRLVARLSGAGIQQFVTTTDLMDSLERSVGDAHLEYGFTMVLGGDVPASRLPTAVLISSAVQRAERVRTDCLALRAHFEAQWRELPLLFVLPSDLAVAGSTLSQHLSSRAPISEQELCRLVSCP